MAGEPSPDRQESGLRIDRWLNVACIFKTRSQAGVACRKGRIGLNGRACKPGACVRTGDEVSVRHRGWSRIVRVRKLPRRNVPRSQAKDLYDDLTPRRPRSDGVETELRVSRPRGSGRPTKKERRSLHRLRRR